MRSAFIERQTASCVRLIPFTLLCNFCSCCWCSASCAKYTFLCFTRVQFSGERIDIWILQSQSLKRNIKFKKRYAAIFASCEMQQNHEIAYRLHTNEHNTTQWCGCVCVLCTLSTFCGLTANQIDQNFVLRSNLLAFTEFFFHSWMALVTWIAGIHQEKCSKCPKYGKEIACHHSYWCDKCRWTSRNPISSSSVAYFIGAMRTTRAMHWWNNELVWTNDGQFYMNYDNQTNFEPDFNPNQIAKVEK